MSEGLREAIRRYGPLWWDSSGPGYGVYVDGNGNEVYLADGTGTLLTPNHQVDLTAMYRQWRYGSDFVLWLRARVTDPEDLHIDWCADCGQPGWEGDMHLVDGDRVVCEDCEEDYHLCESCEEHCRDTTTLLNENEVCESCRYRHYYFCDHCGGWHHHDEDHDHGGCPCESPQQVFTIPNDGSPPLAQDTRATIALPKGFISEEGVAEVQELLRDHGIQVYRKGEGDSGPWYRLASLVGTSSDRRWQTERGNFTKRLSRLAHTEYGLKVPPEILSEVGNIGAAHSQAVDLQIEVTRDLNLPPEEFCHEDSCWWGSYGNSRCSLKSNGGFGLRSFTEETHLLDGRAYDYVSGRAWVLPLRMGGEEGTRPTFDTMTPDAFVVFNGYGDLEGYVPARVLAHMTGWTYRKIGFGGGSMYVNNDSGYLVAPEVIAEAYTGSSIMVRMDDHSTLYSEESKREELVHA